MILLLVAAIFVVLIVLSMPIVFTLDDRTCMS